MRIADALPIVREEKLPDRQDAYVFVDPLTRQPYEEDTPPRYLLENPKMKRGFDYLETYGDRLDVCLLLARHKGPEDLTNNDFESRLAESDYYSHEGYPLMRERIMMTLGRISAGNAYDIYHRQALRNTTTPSFSYDLSAMRLGHMLLRYQDRYRTQLREDEDGKWTPFQFIREWQWVPTFGYQMLRRSQAPQHRLTILMTAGLSHSDIERKLSLYGVNITSHAITKAYADHEIERCTTRAKRMRSGVIIR